MYLPLARVSRRNCTAAVKVTACGFVMYITCTYVTNYTYMYSISKFGGPDVSILAGPFSKAERCIGIHVYSDTKTADFQQDE